MYVLQLLGLDLPYGRVPGARVQMVRHFLALTYIRKIDVAKIPVVPGAPQCKSGPGSNILTNRPNRLLYHFSTTIQLHPASF